MNRLFVILAAIFLSACTHVSSSHKVGDSGQSGSTIVGAWIPLDEGDPETDPDLMIEFTSAGKMIWRDIERQSLFRRLRPSGQGLSWDYEIEGDRLRIFNPSQKNLTGTIFESADIRSWERSSWSVSNDRLTLKLGESEPAVLRRLD